MGALGDSTSQLVQAMAAFGGGSGGANGLNAGFVNADTSQQQPLLTTPQKPAPTSKSSCSKSRSAAPHAGVVSFSESWGYLR
jgi:hypothetical protein